MSKNGQRAGVSFDAIVLLQMGGPATLEEIEPFLCALFADKDIIRLPALMRPFQSMLARVISRRRAPKVRPRYEAMGGGSPLQRITNEQAQRLEKEIGCPVHVAMRYTKPWAHEAVERLKAQGAKRALLLPLFPHYSISTTESSFHDFARAAKKARLTTQLSFVRNWGTHPDYVSLISRTCRETLAKAQQKTREPPHLLLTAHGVPQRYIKEGDTYQREVEETANLVKSSFTHEFETIQQGFQSGLGPVKWIEPETGGLIKRLGKDGGRAIVLSPLGFVSDHIETMYDMDTLFAQTAREAGITTYERVPSFNDDAEFTRLLATIAGGVTQPFEVDKWTS